MEVGHSKTSPTAIGHRPPFFFLKAKRQAPHRCEITSEGTTPEEGRSITLVRACNVQAARPGEGQEMGSFRWEGLRLEGPGAVLAGKYLKDRMTTNSSILMDGGVGERGGLGGAA